MLLRKRTKPAGFPEARELTLRSRRTPVLHFGNSRRTLSTGVLHGPERRISADDSSSTITTLL